MVGRNGERYDDCQPAGVSGVRSSWLVMADDLRPLLPRTMAARVSTCIVGLVATTATPLNYGIYALVKRAPGALSITHKNPNRSSSLVTEIL